MSTRWYAGLELREPPLRSTAQKQLRECPRKFLFSERFGLRHQGYSPALFVGDLFHKFMAAGYLQTPLGDAEHRLIEEAVQNVTPLLDPQLQMLPTGESISDFRSKVEKDAALARAMAEVFFSFYPVERTLEAYAIEAVEQAVRYCDNVIQIDLLLKNRQSGEYWIIDHKTTSESPSDRAAVLPFEFQPAFYKWVLYCSQVGQGNILKLGGTGHNIIRKPTIRFCKKDASFADYVARVKDWYFTEAEKDPNDPPIMQSFIRHTGDFGGPEFTKKLADLQRASRGRPTLSRYYRDEHACFSFGRPCPYLSLCRSENHIEQWPEIIRTRFTQQFRDTPEEESND